MLPCWKPGYWPSRPEPQTHNTRVSMYILSLLRNGSCYKHKKDWFDPHNSKLCLIMLYELNNLDNPHGAKLYPLFSQKILLGVHKASSTVLTLRLGLWVRQSCPWLHEAHSRGVYAIRITSIAPTGWMFTMSQGLFYIIYMNSFI